MDGCAEGWGGSCEDVDGLEYDDTIGMATFATLRLDVGEAGASLKMYTCWGAVTVPFGKG